jgi:type VI secretion system protein ImpH
LNDGVSRPGRNIGWRQMLAEAPWAHDFFRALNMHEALADGRPRLGDSATRREEYLDLGQVPFLDFPASAVASYEPKTERDKARLRVKFLGMLGPMGPLPAATTEEALRWFSRRDDAFVRFLDIFNNRFLQLFFRAHSDARPASHRLRPGDDRFRDYVGSAMGVGGPSWRDLDSLPDLQKVAFAGLLGVRATSASRIEHLVAGIFGIGTQVDQFVGAYLPVPEAEQTRLGTAHALLGDGAVAGRRVLSVDTKFRLRLFPATLAAYERFLPNGAWARRLSDTITNAIGFEFEWDVELVLPDDQPRPAELGAYGRLGWTSWMRKRGQHREGEFVRTRFSPIGDDAVTMLP